MMPIKACAEVLPGLSVKSALKHDPSGTHQVITAMHLSEEGAYHYTDEHLLLIKPKRSVNKYLVKNGDILFISRGSRNRAFLVDHVPKPSVATSTFFIIKGDPNHLRTGYLAWYLNQHIFQAQISEIRTGGGTPMIPRRELLELKIPVPPIELQEKIEKISSLCSKEEKLLALLAEKRKSLVSAACFKALGGR